MPTWSNQAMEAAVPGVLPPLPHRVVYSARYARPSTVDEMTNIQVTVTGFPSAVWATYYLRNIPSPNAQFQQREHFTTIQRDGNLVYQLWMDSFWSSGSDLVTLHCEGTPAPVVDIFLKAYLQKYPSSIERR